MAATRTMPCKCSTTRLGERLRVSSSARQDGASASTTRHQVSGHQRHVHTQHLPYLLPQDFRKIFSILSC